MRPMLIELLISTIMQRELLSKIFYLNCSSEGDCILNRFAITSFTKIFGTEFFQFEIKVNFLNAI